MINPSAPRVASRRFTVGVAAAGLAALMLTGCVTESSSGRPPAAPSLNGPPIAPNVQTREYIPGGSRRTDSRAGKSSPGQTATPHNRRPGSSTPPALLPPAVTAPMPATPPAPGATTHDTDRFKRDLMQPEVDRLRQQNDLGRLDPFQQRDLMNREQEIRQLQTDPLRR